jgi:hypothetical protein
MVFNLKLFVTCVLFLLTFNRLVAMRNMIDKFQIDSITYKDPLLATDILGTLPSKQTKECLFH